jgi:hypothetical protein
MIDDQHKTITEPTQIINTDQSGLTGLSFRPSEELIDHTEKTELGLKERQREESRQLLKRMIVDADPRQVIH